jgi:hypothetical protein
MFKAQNMGRPYNWADLENVNPKRVEEVGLERAMYERSSEVSSPHRASSGQTSELLKAGKSRKERNTIRAAHYKRKGELEGQKEARRRAHWEKYHGHRGAANWEAREAARKTRRAARKTRKH